MTACNMRFSDEPVLVLPATLARETGLQEGAVMVIPGDHCLTITSIPAETDYAARWQTVALSLREQAATFGLGREDCRDDEYWAIVGSLHEDAARWVSSA